MNFKSAGVVLDHQIGEGAAGIYRKPHLRLPGAASGSFRTTSPVCISPETTTRQFAPLSLSCLPVVVLTNLRASSPNLPENFSHPVCGLALNSITASAPIRTRAPGGRLA